MNALNVNKDIRNNIGQNNVFYPRQKIVLKAVIHALQINVSLAHKDTLLKDSPFVKPALICMQGIPRENAKPFKEIAQPIQTAKTAFLDNAPSVNRDLL